MLFPDRPVAVDPTVVTFVFKAYSAVAAGFPSPADDYATKSIDLNAVLIKHPQATFLMRIAGSSMRDAGVDDGDVVLVDCALRPRNGSIIIAVVDGEFTCKRLYECAGVGHGHQGHQVADGVKVADPTGMYCLVDGNNFYVS